MTHLPTNTKQPAAPDWANYSRLTADPRALPTPTVEAALGNHLRQNPSAPGLAIDLGCGAGRDTRYLANAGWRVVAIDSNNTAIDTLRGNLDDVVRERIETICADLIDVALPTAELVVASYSLPFVGASRLLGCWERICAAIKPGGRFSGQFFGEADPMVIEGLAAGVNRAKLRQMFAGFEVELFEEQRQLGPTAEGPEKVWHVYSIVARKLDHAAPSIEGPIKLYHAVPPDLRGSTLMPLSKLQEAHPEIFTVEDAKYKGRELLKSQQVYGLGCLWNDVLHLLPVYPGQLKEAYRELGIAWGRSRYFEIDPEQVKMSSTNSAIYRHDPFNEPATPSRPEEFLPFTQEEARRNVTLPALTRQYYSEMAKIGARPFFANFIPHVFFRGEINIAELTQIEL